MFSKQYRSHWPRLFPHCYAKNLLTVRYVLRTAAYGIVTYRAGRRFRSSKLSCNFWVIIIISLYVLSLVVVAVVVVVVVVVVLLCHVSPSFKKCTTGRCATSANSISSDFDICRRSKIKII